MKVIINKEELDSYKDSLKEAVSSCMILWYPALQAHQFSIQSNKPLTQNGFIFELNVVIPKEKGELRRLMRASYLEIIDRIRSNKCSLSELSDPTYFESIIIEVVDSKISQLRKVLLSNGFIASDENGRFSGKVKFPQ